MKAFGYFKGMPYSISHEDFDEYRKFKNTLPRKKYTSICYRWMHVTNGEPR